MKKQRKHYTLEEKVAFLRRQLLDKEPISKLCDELGLQPAVFTLAERVFRERGIRLQAKDAKQSLCRAEANRLPGEEDPDEDEVLAELMAEHVTLKREVGEL